MISAHPYYTIIHLLIDMQKWFEHAKYRGIVPTKIMEWVGQIVIQW